MSLGAQFRGGGKRGPVGGEVVFELAAGDPHPVRFRKVQLRKKDCSQLGEDPRRGGDWRSEADGTEEGADDGRRVAHFWLR